ncbi:MAG: methyltransferase, partial [Leptospiraceae bacterium]|nr:methyltransferase [Leptospiraceae bacterium]
MKSLLYLISTPIGNHKDLSPRAVEILERSDLIIGEEFKETSKLLKKASISREFELLNEHSSEDDIEEIFQKLKSSEISSLF